MSDTNIPSEIKEKIEDYIKSFGYKESKHGNWKTMYDAAEYGYLLASKTIDERDQELKMLSDWVAMLERKDDLRDEAFTQQASTIAALEAEMAKMIAEHQKELEQAYASGAE